MVNNLPFTVHFYVAFACSTFVYNEGGSYIFGRNLDWVSDDGVVVVNKRGESKQAIVFPPNQPASWVSKYGSITFNQFGKELPFGGVNEKGLIVEIMLVKGAYPMPDERKAVNELQWIQYQLDNCKSVAEVIATDKLIRISKIDQQIHFLVTDALGETAVIEFEGTGMHIYQGDKLPVKALENDPYEVSLQKWSNGQSSRFLTMAKALNLDKSVVTTDVVSNAFGLLDKVALEGSWSVVYDLKESVVYFKTASHRAVRHFSLTQFDFSNQTPALLYDMKERDKGDIGANFVPFNLSLNNEKLSGGIKTNGIEMPVQALALFYGLNNEGNVSNLVLRAGSKWSMYLWGLLVIVFLFVAFRFLRKKAS